MLPQTRELLIKLEHELGPWYATDRPEDVLVDIRRFSPEDADRIAVEAIRQYLKEKCN